MPALQKKHKKSSVHNLKSVMNTRYGRSAGTRTLGLLLPNLSGELFLLVYSGFQCFSICFTYSLTLLSPLCPHVPAPSVVIYVVKNASRPVSGEDSPVPGRKRFRVILQKIGRLHRFCSSALCHTDLGTLRLYIPSSVLIFQ